MNSLTALKEKLESNNHSHIKIGFTDIDGLMLGKYLKKSKFLSAIEKGFSFCDVALGWDIKDQLYDNAQFTGWHTGYPDTGMQVIPESERTLPFEDNIPFFLTEFTGDAEAICPRGTLRRVLSLADRMGFEVKAGFEYEFFVFNESRESAKAKGFKNLTMLSDDWCGYSMLRTSVHSEFHHGLLQLCETLNCPLEGLHTETGPGVIEAALQVDDALNAADKATIFKTATKIYAERQQRLATFMAKWSEDYPGQSGHIHISLIDKKTKKNCFYDDKKTHQMSDLQQYFVGGIQKILPESIALLAPTINSYKRLIPGFWAPTDSTWGIENRTTAIRVIPGSESTQRVEIRAGAADANPYLALAAALAAGLSGIQHQWQPSEAIEGNAYDQTHADALRFPTDLSQATQRFKSSDVLREQLGHRFVDHYSTTREWEVREYHRHISTWELDRYLELI